MAHVPMAVPVTMGVPVQLQMGGSGSTPLEASGFKTADKTEWNGGPWQIVGEDSQTLMAILQPGQAMMTEPGGMLSHPHNVTPQCDTGGCCLAFQRCLCAGESCFRVHWKNESSETVSVALGPSFPAKIVMVDLDQEGGEMNIKKMSWMASMNSGTEFGMRKAPSLCAACCGGQGCCLTTIKGSGVAFLNVGGTVVQKRLLGGESIIVDTSSLVAWSKTIKFEVKQAGNCMTMCCGGMGMYNTKVTGPGLVIIQSMPFEKAAATYRAVMMSKGGKGGGVGGESNM